MFRGSRQRTPRARQSEKPRQAMQGTEACFTGLECLANCHHQVISRFRVAAMHRKNLLLFLLVFFP